MLVKRRSEPFLRDIKQVLERVSPSPALPRLCSFAGLVLRQQRIARLHMISHDSAVGKVHLIIL
jgi:hypothetical protein